MSVIVHLWQSTIVAVMAAAVVWTLRHRSAHLRHAIWALASIKFLVPFSLLTLIGGGLGAWALPSTTAGALAAAGWLDAVRPFLTLDVGATADVRSLPGTYSSAAAVALWTLGAGGILAWRSRQWLTVSRTIAQAEPVESEREVAALASAARHAGWNRTPSLRRVTGVYEPVVIGVLRPAILWPPGLAAQLTDAELEAVFAHELCHVARRDNLLGLLHIAVEIVFWFHPIVWWLGGRLVHERERACDEEVLRMGTNKDSYAAAILKVCNFCLRMPAAFAAGIGGSQLSERIERVLDDSAARAKRSPVLLAAMAALIFILPLTIGVLDAHRAAPQRPATVYKPGNGVSQPKLVKETKPRYTREAMEAKIQGIVRLTAIVLVDGTVGDVAVTESLDKEHGLDDEAVRALKQWLFEPGTKDGEPVAVEVQIEMSFTLK